MVKVTISAKYQVVIPKQIRQSLNLKKGQKMIVLVKDGIINLLPEKPLSEMKGVFKGMDIKDLREERERA
ncbi:MAG TPA: AbrB/MazE/SpoVT family DNA-binding domain-containing protein [Candidatus Desulfofervidus auxilii]|uniref:AbrB/MazE/SpoVT family DNA-binding domain-containing protein n=1 Tax=Desulfofervidus auxilii TaxID=1621989 RepID=A0A7C1ZFK9_DESA2|nr:AbrB/MazE/SpoVT family DNA-binding domain-containing protein [Candidatus Desulfofervidus auxilii]